MDLQRAFEILELKPGVTLSQAKGAYRDLAAVWHPDRHSHNPRLQQKAVKKMQQINTAYGLLQSHLSSTASSTINHPKSKSSTTVRYCPECGAVIGSKNRVLCVSCMHKQRAKKTDEPASVHFSGLGMWRVCVVIVTLVSLVGVGYFFVLPDHSTGNGQPEADNAVFVADKDGRFRIDHFNQLEKITLLRLQHRLTILGYTIGKVDGIVGPNTLAAANQFYDDFNGLLNMKDAAALADTVALQAIVAREYSSWRQLVQSGKFERWLAKQGTIVQEKWHPDSPKSVVSMLDRYFFLLKQPSVLPLPPSGVVLQENALGRSRVQLLAAGNKDHFFVKVLEEKSGEEVLSAFIRAGDSIQVKLYVGAYRIKWASGARWYGKKYLFGTETVQGGLGKILNVVRSDDTDQRQQTVRVGAEATVKSVVQGPLSVFSF